MPSYYFDCETSREDRDHPDPKLDKIISISFQRIGSRTGNPIGELQILKFLTIYNFFFRIKKL